jgi:hypothetical protein
MISLLYPIKNRLPLFKNTIDSILSYYNGIKNKFEIILLSNILENDLKNYVLELKNILNISYIIYNYPNHYCEMINPAYAFNLGCNLSKYNSIILSSPEIKHKTPVIKQLLELTGQNILCKVEELDNNGKLIQLLMGEKEPDRKNNPGMYFIGMYNKKDYIDIGGLDEKYMIGLDYEDKDFGLRFMHNFTTTDSIVGIHQQHPRYYHYNYLYSCNAKLLERKRENLITVANSNIKMGDISYIERII